MKREKDSARIGYPGIRPGQGNATVQFMQADDSWLTRIAEFSEWGENAARHMHFVDGFSYVAVESDSLVGLISVYWETLPAPLVETREAYIDILEVHKDFRKKGIATKLIEMSDTQAREEGAYQLRSWSSLDKNEAIPMWKALGFGLCPASTLSHGKEVKGYFVARLVGKD